MHGPDTTERETVELETVNRSPGPGRTGRWWRGLTGSLAAGLVALLLLVLGAQVAGWVNGSEGPGMLPVAGHVAGAALALVAQRFADRHEGRTAGVAGAGVVAVAVAVLWLFWWS